MLINTHSVSCAFCLSWQNFAKVLQNLCFGAAPIRKGTLFMSNNLFNYQCPKCNGALQFNASKQILKCDYCDSEFPKELFEKKEQASVQNTPDNTQAGGVNAETAGNTTTKVDWSTQNVMKEHEVMGAQAGFSCKACGAEIVSDGVTAATECMYCGNPVVLTNNITGMVTPDYVIPFKIDKNKAIEMLKEFYKGKPLIPSAFKDNNKLNKITGMYVPFWLFSCKGDGDALYYGKKVTSWSDGTYEYEKTETYEVTRAGSLAFESIPVDASVKMEDHYMDGVEPYDYSEMVEFSPMYMAGYFADKFDVSTDDSTQRVTDRVVESLKDAFEDTIVNYTSFTNDHANINMHGDDIRYALLPVWILNTKYNGELYKFVINGQTGRVSGKLPIDNAKLWLYRIGITIAATIPAYGILSFLLG